MLGHWMEGPCVTKKDRAGKCKPIADASFYRGTLRRESCRLMVLNCLKVVGYSQLWAGKGGRILLCRVAELTTPPRPGPCGTPEEVVL